MTQATAEPQAVSSGVDPRLLAMDLAPIAKPTDAKLTIFAYGGPGTHKTRFALSFPKVLIVDLERSSMHYAGEFQFRRAVPLPNVGPVQLVDAIVAKFKAGHFPDVETLVIDPITVYFEAATISLQRKIEATTGQKLHELKGIGRSHAFDLINDSIRRRMEALKSLDWLHQVWIARERQAREGAKPTYEARPEAAYLADVEMRMLGKGAAEIGKARASKLRQGQIIKSATFEDFYSAFALGDAAPLPEGFDPDHAPIEKTSIHDEALEVDE